jgi:hypothetical protein
MVEEAVKCTVPPYVPTRWFTMSRATSRSDTGVLTAGFEGAAATANFEAGSLHVAVVAPVAVAVQLATVTVLKSNVMYSTDCPELFVSYFTDVIKASSNCSTRYGIDPDVLDPTTTTR